MQTKKGQSIEDASMAVIESEIGPHPYGKDEWPIVRRVIHSTADFDFARSNAISFQKGAIDSGIAALQSGCHIVTDVNGVSGLLNKASMAGFGNGLVCRISEPGVAEAASAAGTTRARASMRASAEQISGGVVAVGNAPTALQEVLAMASEGAAQPALVVGMPVGFICAAEAKEELAASGLPYITNRGRKGGSASAAAIINALYKIAQAR